MDSLLGLVGKDFTIVAADASVGRSIVTYQTCEDKILALDKFKLLAAAGPVGDRHQFSEYIAKNLQLHEFRTDVKLTTPATAAWTRNVLADSIRRAPYQVNLLLGGFDANKGPSLYYLDYLGSMCPMPSAAHGYGSNFTLSLMDRYYKQNMSLDEGVDLIRKCIKELSLRFLINQPKWVVKVVDKDGVRVLDLGEVSVGEKKDEGAYPPPEAVGMDTN